MPKVLPKLCNSVKSVAGDQCSSEARQKMICTLNLHRDIRKHLCLLLTHFTTGSAPAFNPNVSLNPFCKRQNFPQFQASNAVSREVSKPKTRLISDQSQFPVVDREAYLRPNLPYVNYFSSEPHLSVVLLSGAMTCICLNSIPCFNITKVIFHLLGFAELA